MQSPRWIRTCARAAGVAVCVGVTVCVAAEADSLEDAPRHRRNHGPGHVELTWMSIANWYFEIGNLRIVMDGYITRVPGPPFFVPSPQFPGDAYTTTLGPRTVETGSIERVIDALPARRRLDYLLAGHSHFDHSWDTPTWAKLTGASLLGGLSTCYQAQAQNLPQRQCRVVDGGEAIQLGHGVTMHVVRFNHSGNDANPIQHFARELSGPPTPDSATGGLRAGVGEDYPNGGGGRAFLFTVDTGGQRLSFFVQNSASAFDLDKDIIVDGINYGAPLSNKPKAYIPSHWDGLFNNFWAGMPFPYKDEALRTFLDTQGIALMPQQQYFDKYRLDARGVTSVENGAVKRKLEFSAVQPFDAAMRAAVARVATTVLGDDCGEDGIESAWGRSTFAHHNDLSKTYFSSAVETGGKAVESVAATNLGF